MIVPIEGFSLKLIFANPAGPMPEGKSPQAATHPGMKPLMDRMAKILRERAIDFAGIMGEAVEELAGEVTVDAEQFTKSLNMVRAASGLHPLVSAEGEVGAQLEEALMVYREQWAAEQEAHTQARVKAAIEAHEAARAGGAGPERGGYDGEPPPPRGVARKASKP